MSEDCGTTSSQHGHLEELWGKKIVGIEIIGGGDKYCNMIEIKIEGGQLFHIEKYLDVSQYGIDPRIKYGIGSWWEITPEEQIKIEVKEENES